MLRIDVVVERQMKWFALVAILTMGGVGLARRIRVANEYTNFAGDGWQYFHLAEQLAKNHRYAFAPPPVPLANTRLPGYPVFIASLGWSTPFLPQTIAARVTHVQAVIDCLTALLALLIARELGLKAAPWLGFALCLASPFLALCVSYVLTETVAIFLTTLALWLLLRACRGRIIRHSALAGGAVGLGMLVRADATMLLPCLFLPLLFSRATRRQKATAAIAALATAAAVFSPWPLRNAIRFGALHPTGSEWVNKIGDPLGTGPQAWLRTWAVDPHEAANVAWTITRAAPLIGGQLPANAYDSPAERKRLFQILDEYNRLNWVTPDLDKKFAALALERRQRDRWRYYVTLPLQRAAQLWLEPVPEWELPITSLAIDAPELRSTWRRLNQRTLCVALVGLIVLFSFRAGRPLATLAIIAALARTTALTFVVPGGTQRYLFELMPMVLVIAGVGLAGPAELILRRLGATRLR